MFSDVRHHAIYSINNARIREFPYPHFISDQVFPADFYQEILSRLPAKDDFTSMKDTKRVIDPREDSPYKNRLLITLTEDVIEDFAKKDQTFWMEMLRLLKNVHFIQAILLKFEPYLKKRFSSGPESVDFYTDIQLIRDFEGYDLGPHSDHPDKVAVVIFYLPKTDENPNLGTSIYVPKQEEFTCNKGNHYYLEDFNRVFTAPYVPNTAFGFFKTSTSFHGVEKVLDANVQRDLIQLSIKQE